MAPAWQRENPASANPVYRTTAFSLPKYSKENRRSLRHGGVFNQSMRSKSVHHMCIPRASVVHGRMA
jgi:hypothetical protein